MASSRSGPPRPSILTLNEHGDLSATPGSLKWAIAVRAQLGGRIHTAEFARGSVGQMAHLMQKYEGHRQLYNQAGEHFPTYRAFCEEPEPWGLGYDPDVLQRLIDGPKRPTLPRDPQDATRVVCESFSPNELKEFIALLIGAQQ